MAFFSWFYARWEQSPSGQRWPSHLWDTPACSLLFSPVDYQHRCQALTCQATHGRKELMEKGSEHGEKTEMKESIEWKRFLARAHVCIIFLMAAVCCHPFGCLSLSLSLSADSEHVLQAIIMWIDKSSVLTTVVYTRRLNGEKEATRRTEETAAVTATEAAGQRNGIEEEKEMVIHSSASCWDTHPVDLLALSLYHSLISRSP